MCLECKARSTFRFSVTLLLLLLVHASPHPAAAQEGCTGIPSGGAAAVPDLRGFTPLFRQAGVAFLTRIEEAAPPGASLAVVNENPFPVTVDFGLQVAVGEEGAPPREVPLGRRCLGLAAGEAVELPATPPGPGAGQPIREVRVLSLGISGLTGASPAPRAAEPRGDAAADPEPAPPQFRCAEAPEGNARAACTAAYLAASARAAAHAGAFAGTTRACLLEYAALQERTAELLRRGGPAGAAPLDRAPPCFSEESARWDFSMLQRLCPGGSWTPENRGVTTCRTPGLVPEPETAAAPTPEPPPPPESAPAPGLGGPSRRREIDLQLVLRLLLGTALSLAGAGILLRILQALALLLIVLPAGLLRRILGAAVPR